MSLAPTAPPGAPRASLVVSQHAVVRYQERIENVPAATVCGRLRLIAAAEANDEAWVGRKGYGPPCGIKAVDNVITTVYPVTRKQVRLAEKRKVWRI